VLDSPRRTKVTLTMTSAVEQPLISISTGGANPPPHRSTTAVGDTGTGVHRRARFMDRNRPFHQSEGRLK
jgi:hypothetical protein